MITASTKQLLDWKFTCNLIPKVKHTAPGEVVDNDSDGDGVCDADEVLGCDIETACGDTYNPFATDTDSSLCLFMDPCGVCDGDTLCEIFIQDTIEILVDSVLIADIQEFASNFEDLLETELGLPEGTVVVLDISDSTGSSIFPLSRSSVSLNIDYSITLTQEELNLTEIDLSLSNEEIIFQINSELFWELGKV